MGRSGKLINRMVSSQVTLLSTGHKQRSHNGNVTAGPNDRQKDITGLKEYVLYNITVLAFTAVGNGPSSTPVVVVRTDEDGKLVIWQKTSLSLNCFINPCICFCNHSSKFLNLPSATTLKKPSLLKLSVKLCN